MKTIYELKKYKAVNSKRGEIVGYFDTLEQAKVEANKYRLHSICEFEKVKYFKNF